MLLDSLLIFAAILLYYAGRSVGRQQERERQEFLQDFAMPTTSRERYRLFEICTAQRVDGSWSVRWHSTWRGRCPWLQGESSGGVATMAMAVEQARSVVDAYWECEAEEHWAELVERGYVGLEG